VDFVLNNLYYENDKFPIQFQLQFDINSKIISELSISNQEIDEINYYNLCCVEQEIQSENTFKENLLDSFRSSLNAFSPSKV